MREARQIGKLDLAAGRPPQCVRSSMTMALVPVNPSMSPSSTFPLTSSTLPLSWASVLRVLDMALTLLCTQFSYPLPDVPLPMGPTFVLARCGRSLLGLGTT